MEDAEKYNALDYVSKIHSPILIILGTKDDDVLPAETKTIYEKANQPKELFEFEGMTHDYKNYPDKLRIVNEKVIGFYKKYL